MKYLIALLLLVSLVACTHQNGDDNPNAVTTRVDTIKVYDTIRIVDLNPKFELPNNNFFYRGITNDLRISLPDSNWNGYSVEASGGEIRGENGNFKVVPGKDKWVSVSVLDHESKVVIEKAFAVWSLPDPKAYLAGITGSGNLPRNKLLAAQGVLAKMEDFAYDARYEIISFNMMATVNGREVELRARGPRITGDMRTLVAAVKPGQNLHIIRIKAKGPDGTIRDLGAITITVI